MDLSKLGTETRNQNTYDLDELSALEIIQKMNDEDKKVAYAVEKELPTIAKLIEKCAHAIQEGGRIVYMGAGTSGRLGLLDSVECPPTFGVEPDLVIGLIAGGDNAFIKAVEGAEDKEELGVEDLKKINCNSKDIVIGLAASGRTPYIIGALKYARQLNCTTATVSCNKGAVISSYADIAIEVDNGPEALTGSTRLKSGTSQKMICNMISTATMVLCGKVYQNLMVDVKQTNEKLVNRAERIIMEATNCSKEVATQVRIESEGRVKVAIVMVLLNCDVKTAEKRLENSKGYVRGAIECQKKYLSQI